MSEPDTGTASGPGWRAVATGATAAAALVGLAAWQIGRALDPGLPLGVHGFDLWLASLPAWVASGVLLLLVGEPPAGARLAAGRVAFVLFAALSPPASGAVCGAVRWFQTARLAAAFRDEARAVEATVTAVRWRTRTVEQERPRRTVEVTTPYLLVEYRLDGPRSLELKTDEETATAYQAALRASAGLERAGVPYDGVAWALPGAPEHAVLGAVGERPELPVSGVVPTLVCLGLSTALVVGFRRG